MKQVTALLALIAATAGTLAVSPANAELGDEVVVKMYRLYNDTRKACGTAPALECSGLIMRALDPNVKYGPWSISPTARSSGGISASYLRKDAKFKTLAWNLRSGIILDTVADNPEHHVDYTMLCAFPIDAGSSYRERNGCANSTITADHTEQLCHEKKVTTAEQWLADYKTVGRDNSKQCGFDIRPERKELAATAFYESLRATNLLARESYGIHNEVRIALWNEDPIQEPSTLATFYVEDSGLYGARLYQIQYWYHTHQHKPVVYVKMPQTLADDAEFFFRKKDQVIYPTTEKNACPEYIKSAKWIERDDHDFKKKIWSLSVVPSDCGRAIGPGQTNNFFNELVTFYWNFPQWKENTDNRDDNIASMRRQLVCHFLIFRTKTEWNLEPSRPYVTSEDSVKRACNSF